jgi:WD40 repeat protein
MPGEAGNLIVGRYALLEPVGESGVGRVWRAQDWLLGREVAVQEVVLPPVPAQESAELMAGLQQWARVAAQLDHPGVVAVFDVVEQDGAAWVVMPFLPGTTLGAEIGLIGRVPWAVAARIAGQVAEALARVHGAGLVHGDLTPASIVLTGPSGDRVVVTGFGTAQVREASARLAGPEAAPGTVAFLAPEQLLDGAQGAPAGPAADMWALGAVLYAAVEGRAPFTGPATADVVAAIRTGPLTMPEYAGPLRDLIAALLAKDPADRPGPQAVVTAVTAVAGLAAGTVAGTGPGVTAGAPAWGGAGPAPAAGAAAWGGAGPVPAAGTPAWGAAGPAPAVATPAVARAAGGSRLVVAAIAVLALVTLVIVSYTLAQKLHSRSPVSRAAASRATGRAAAASPTVPNHVTVSPTASSPGAAFNTPAETNLAPDSTVTLSDHDLFAGVAFSPDGQTVAASAENKDNTAGHLDIWNSPSGKQAATLADTAANGNMVAGLTFSPNNVTILAAGDYNGIDIWNLPTGGSRMYANPDGFAVTDVAFALDGTTIAECDEGGQVSLLNTETGQWLAQDFTDPAANPSSIWLLQVAFSPDGKSLAAADSAGNVYVWRLSGGAPLVIKGKASNGYQVQTFAFSPDGRTLAVALQGGVQLWDMATRKLTFTLTSDITSPDAVAFSSDGSLAVGDEGGTLSVWNLITRSESVLNSSSGGWAELAYSPDGKTLAAIEATDSDLMLYRLG